MRFAVVGSRGQVGKELTSSLKAQNSHVTGFSRDEFDIAELEIPDMIRKLEGADVVFNTSGYTKVDFAEENFEEAMMVNGTGVENLVLAANEIGAKLIHISTDYVFDGKSDSPYTTVSKTAPQTKYGVSKKFGEDAILEKSEDFILVRSSWIYGKHGNNFPKAIASQLLRAPVVDVVNDQLGQPTWATDLVERIIYFATLGPSKRIEHCSSSGIASWYDFATEICLSMGMNPNKVINPVSTAKYPSAANRPSWSVLENSDDLLEPIGDWRERWKLAAPSVLEGLLPK